MDFTQAGRLHGRSSRERRLRAAELLGAVRGWAAQRRRRRDADRRLAAAAGTVAPDLAWRAAELTSRHERKLLVRSLRSVVDELSRTYLPGASPLNRVALRPHVHELTVLADRLADLDRPVSPAGILAVQRLLTDPDGPFYARGYDASEAPTTRALARALAGLEPR